MKAKKKKTKKRIKPDLIDHAAKYLKEKGWSMIVGGPVRVQQDFACREYHFELVIPFTGGKLDAQEKQKE